MVEEAALQPYGEGRHRLQSDHVEQHDRGGRVVRAVMERRGLPLDALPMHLLELLVPHLHLFGARWPERAHRLREVPEGRRVVEVERLAAIVLQHPGEDRVLVRVVVRAPGERVEAHQELKVGDLARLPAGTELLDPFRVGRRDDVGARARVAQLREQPAAPGLVAQVEEHRRGVAEEELDRARA